MFKTLFANSFSFEFMYLPLYFLQALKINHSLHVYTLGNSKSEREGSHTRLFVFVGRTGDREFKEAGTVVVEASFQSKKFVTFGVGVSTSANLELLRPAPCFSCEEDFEDEGCNGEWGTFLTVRVA